MVSKGDKITVVRGVKVPKGTTGVAFWVGETKYGLRVGFKNDANGETLWTAMGNVERTEVDAPAPAPVANSVSPAYIGSSLAALAATIAKLEARIEALEAASAAPAPFIPDNADPLEIAAFTN